MGPNQCYHRWYILAGLVADLNACKQVVVFGDEFADRKVQY